MTQPAVDTSKDATDEAEKAAEAIGGQEEVVQADVHQEPEQEPDYPLEEEDKNEDEEEEEDKEEDKEEDVEDPDYEATEEGANVIGTLRVKVHICQVGNRMSPSG